MLGLECTTFDFHWGSAPDPAGAANSVPRPLAVFKGPTSKGSLGEEGGDGKEEGTGREEERGVEGTEGEGQPLNILA